MFDLCIRKASIYCRKGHLPSECCWANVYIDAPDRPPRVGYIPSFISNTAVRPRIFLAGNTGKEGPHRVQHNTSPHLPSGLARRATAQRKVKTLLHPALTPFRKTVKPNDDLSDRKTKVVGKRTPHLAHLILAFPDVIPRL